MMHSRYLKEETFNQEDINNLTHVADVQPQVQPPQDFNLSGSDTEEDKNQHIKTSRAKLTKERTSFPP